jgi:hypothetical protein
MILIAVMSYSSSEMNQLVPRQEANTAITAGKGQADAQLR